MKRALIFAALVAVAAVSAYAAGPISVRPAQVLSALKFFSEQYPRTEGSQGEKRSVAYIKDHLRTLGIPYSQEDFHELEGTHSFSSSLEVDIKGILPDALVIVVPLDHPQEAKPNEDGSINLALALGMIEALHRASLPISLKFLFLGGEFGSGPGYPIGTKQFLANFYPDYPVAVLYLNFRYVPVRANLTAGGRRIIAPYWLINRCSAAMDKAGFFYLLRGNETQVFRLGLITKAPPINPYLQAGYPAIELSSLPGRLPRSDYTKWVSSFVGSINNLIDASRPGFPTNWDRHYLFFQARSFSFILTERNYVLLVVLFLGLLVIYPVVFRERFMRYLRTIARNVLSVPLLLVLVFAFLLLGTLLVEAISVIRNYPTIWEQAPFLFFVCKIAAALFLFALLYRFLKNLPFSRNGRFYSAGAILLLLVDSIVLGLLNFSLAYYFVWALIWSVLFSVVRWRWLKLAFLAISTGWLIKATVDIFTLPALDVVHAILLSRIKGNIILALIILPFLFMLIRADLLFRHPRRGKGVTIIRALDTLLGVITAGLFVYLSLVSLYGPTHPQPITFQEQMNLNSGSRSVEVSSPAPIGTIDLRTATFSKKISTRSRHYAAVIPGVKPVLKVQTSSSSFLDRKRFELHIQPVGKPYRVTVTLSSKSQIVIFDSNFPFSYGQSGNDAEIHIGANPPFPLDVQFTLPQNARVDVALGLTYTTLPYPVDISGTDVSVQKSLVVRKTFSLGGTTQ